MGQIKRWLQTARDTYQMCGVEGERYAITQKEAADLRGLKRGVFAKRDLNQGEKLSKDNTFYAIPCRDGQLVANDIAKYVEYALKRPVRALKPVDLADVFTRNLRARVIKILKDLKEIILKSHIALPNKIDLELSHHYGIEQYEKWGAAILNCINREYCKKLIILLPEQRHPFHHHVKKEETFQVLYGSMEVTVGKEVMELKAGDILTVERGVRHNFSSKGGAIFEEVSTTHFKDDSFYDDEKITNNSGDRKTELTFRSDWLYKAIN
jgi:mannose-6-phosphate isomerase-like protein (cupin superfamily)